jgi:hypothetical protein
MNQVDLMPRKLAERLEEFLKDARTGSVTLHVKDGSILAWEVKESGNG